MASSWPKAYPAYYYLANFLGALLGGVFVVWLHNLWMSVPFWMIVIKNSTMLTLLVFSAISAYRFFLSQQHWQQQDVCEV